MVFFFLIFLFIAILDCKKTKKVKNAEKICSPGCPKKNLGNGVCDWKCYNYACKYDHGDCKNGCKTNTPIFPWLKIEDEDLLRIYLRLYMKNETCTLIDGKYIADYNFKKNQPSLKEDLSTYDPEKPGRFYPWDQMLEVVLGRVEGAGVPELDPPLLNTLNRDSVNHYNMSYFLNKKQPSYLFSKGIREMNNYEKVLSQYGAKVYRPEILDFMKPQPGLYKSGYTNAQARDAILVVGNHFITSRFASRGRALEVSTYKKILDRAKKLGAYVHQWKEPTRKYEDYNLFCLDQDLRKYLDKHQFPDKDCKFPLVKEIETIKRFQIRFKKVLDEILGSHFDWSTRTPAIDFCPLLNNEDTFFEAPDCEPIGNDVFCILSSVTNLAGLRYVSHSLGKKFRVHILPYNPYQNQHIDDSFMPIKPGLMFIKEHYISRMNLPPYFDEWKIVNIPKSKLSMKEYLEKYDLFYSNILNGNFLVLDTKHVVIQPNEPATKKLLEKYGFETIEVPLFHSTNPINGGSHCATNDFWRDGRYLFDEKDENVDGSGKPPPNGDDDDYDYEMEDDDTEVEIDEDEERFFYDDDDDESNM